MNINAIAKMVQTVAPNLKIGEAINQAQQMTNGVSNDIGAVSKKAAQIGITPEFINNVYRQYGNNPQIKQLCSMLGTTPDAIKKDADKLFGKSSNSGSVQSKADSSRFPRL